MKKLHWTFPLIALFAMATHFSPVYACQDSDDAATSQESRRFKEADLDSNGNISRSEMKSYLKSKLPDFRHFNQLMPRLDQDNDKVLSPKEFAKRRQVATRLENHPVEFADRYNAQFEPVDPKLGSTIRDLVAFDENGKAININQLKGKYTVLTFGCLT